jgi:L-threonylcarbamoyladenylate synthase
MILRPGGISLEQLQRVLGNISTDPSIASGHTGSTPPRSPGMKYRHYAPKASLLLVKGPQEQVVGEISRRADSCLMEGKAVGILAADETAASYAPSLHDSCRILSLGSRQRPETLAANLFKRLREFDEKGVDVIFAETPDSDGIGMAVLNRLMKAAGGNIITV